jgi:predicted aconitase with swiveling domain
LLIFFENVTTQVLIAAKPAAPVCYFLWSGCLGRMFSRPGCFSGRQAPSGIAETLRNGSGPLAFVLGERDVNISIGVLVANRLYGLDIPVLQLPKEQMERVASGDDVTIRRSGILSIARKG